MKRMGIFRRRDGMTLPAFAHHWSGQHAEIANRMQRLRHYRQNHALRDTDEPSNPDGIAELWWKDAAQMASDFADPGIGAALEADEPLFMGRISVLILEEGEIRGRETGSKLMVLGRGRPVAELDGFVARLEGVVGIGRDRVAEALSRRALPPLLFLPNEVTSIWLTPGVDPVSAAARLVDWAGANSEHYRAFAVRPIVIRDAGTGPNGSRPGRS